MSLTSYPLQENQTHQKRVAELLFASLLSEKRFFVLLGTIRMPLIFKPNFLMFHYVWFLVAIHSKQLSWTSHYRYEDYCHGSGCTEIHHICLWTPSNTHQA